MKKRDSLPYLLLKTFGGIAALYTIFSLVIIFAHGGSTLEETTFEYYSKSQTFFISLKYVYVLTSLFTIPYNIISTSESFEDMNFLKACMQDSKGVRRSSLIISRVILLLLVYLASIPDISLSDILDLGGSIISPVLSYFLPVCML